MLTHHWPPNTHHSIFSGYERIAYYLGAFCDVNILTWRFMNQSNQEDDSQISVHRVFTLPSDILLERRLGISFGSLYYGKNNDMIHSLYSIPAFFPSFKYPTIATVHITSDFTRNNIWLNYKTLLQKSIFNKTKGLIVVSTKLKEFLEEKYHAQNINYIPPGIDTDYFCAESSKKWKEKLISHNFEFISFTSGVNGTDFLLLFKIAIRFPRILFFVLGKEIHGHPPNVRFISGITDDELKTLYNVADIFIKPLNFATANNSILEAMSMSKPIITDAIPGVLDYLDKKCAFLVEKKRDYPEIIRNALSSDKERRLKGRNARKKAEREFDWKTVAAKTYEVYEAIVEP